MVTSRDYITDILEVCLERLRAGDSVTACLQDYPHCADELAPLLNSAEYARRVPPAQLNPAVRQAIQRQLRSAIAGRAPQRRAPTSWYRMPVLRFSALLLALVLAIGGGTVGVAAAQSSLPGSPLYPVKRAGESLRLTLTTSPDQRAILHMDFAQARLVETLALLDSQQPADERVLDDLAREYELAWANIQLLPAGAAQKQRERFIAEGKVEVAALTEALEHAPHANRPALEAALRSNQATLVLAAEKERSTPKPPVDDHPPTPGHAVPPGNNQGNGNGNGQPTNPGNGQGDGNGNGNGNGQPADPGNGNGNGNGNSKGQPADPGDGNGNGQPADPGNGNGGDHSNSDPADQSNPPGQSDKNDDRKNNQDNSITTPGNDQNTSGANNNKDKRNVP